MMKWADFVDGNREVGGWVVGLPAHPPSPQRRSPASIHLLYLHLGVITRAKVWRFDTRQIDSFTATAGPGGDNEVED